MDRTAMIRWGGLAVLVVLVLFVGFKACGGNSGQQQATASLTPVVLPTPVDRMQFFSQTGQNLIEEAKKLVLDGVATPLAESIGVVAETAKGIVDIDRSLGDKKSIPELAPFFQKNNGYAMDPGVPGSLLGDR